MLSPALTGIIFVVILVAIPPSVYVTSAIELAKNTPSLVYVDTVLALTVWLSDQLTLEKLNGVKFNLSVSS